jgi:hypothetical protein
MSTVPGDAVTDGGQNSVLQQHAEGQEARLLCKHLRTQNRWVIVSSNISVLYYNSFFVQVDITAFMFTADC